MERAEQHSAQVNERNEHQAANPQHRRVPGPQTRLGDRAPHQLIADIEEQEKESQRESRVPGPPRSPNWLPPDRPRRQDHPSEHGPHFRGRGGEAIEAGIFQEQIEDARHADQDHGHLRPYGGRHVDVEDLLRQALHALLRCEREGAHVHARQKNQAHQGHPPAALRKGHSFTVVGNSMVASVRNTCPIGVSGA